MMLSLIVNQEPLDLLPDSTITIDEVSPLFEKDSIPGGFSYPFNLPVTPTNRRLTGFADRLERKVTGRTELPFQLFHSGKLIHAGNLVIIEAADHYRANLEISNGDLSSKIKNKKLKDLDLGGTRNWVWQTEYKYGTDDFALFPIYNDEFSEFTPDPAYGLNHYRLNSFENGSFYHEPGKHYVVCPFAFINYLIKQIFTQYGFQIIENVFETDADLSDLVLYTTWDITYQEVTYSLQNVLLGIDQYGEEVWEEINVGVGVRVQDEWNLADCMPDMLVSDFLLSLRNLFNLGISIDSSNRVRIVKRQDVVLQPSVQNITGLISGSPLIAYLDTADGYKLTWDHDEQDQLFDTKWQDIENVLDDLGDDVANSGELAALEPIPNEVRYVISLDKYFRYEFDQDNSYWKWAEYSIGFQNFLSGNRQEEFASKFSTLLMVTYQRLTGGPFIRCPWADQQGNASDASVNTPFSPRLLFYRGLQLNSDGDAEPMGSNDNLDRTGNKLAGKSLCLRWEGNYGLFAQLWEKYMHWYNTRKTVTYMVTDPTVLNFKQKYAIDGKHFLLKKRTINLTMNGILPGECEFYQV